MATKMVGIWRCARCNHTVVARPGPHADSDESDPKCPSCNKTDATMWEGDAEVLRDNDCLIKADDSEPIFVLRAQDLSAPSTIRTWALANINNGRLPIEKYDEALKCAEQMEEWQRLNPSLAKWPD